MDNISNSNLSDQQQSVNNLPFIVLLNPPQYTLYKTSALEILAPDSNYLESIGHNVKKDIAEIDAYQLHNQIALLESLFNKINQDLELPPRAVTGLADMFFKMNDYLVKYGK